MNKWIALLRGINVGGRNIVPMEELRASLTQLGFQNVETYIQSGNCVFETDLSSANEIANAIRAAINAQFGFEPLVVALTVDDFAKVIAENPYKDVEEHKTVHFSFLTQPAVDVNIDALTAIKKPSESFTLTDMVFYLQAPEGIGRSKLAAKTERKLGVKATTRNLRSVMKIAELAGIGGA